MMRKFRFFLISLILHLLLLVSFGVRHENTVRRRARFAVELVQPKQNFDPHPIAAPAPAKPALTAIHSSRPRVRIIDLKDLTGLNSTSGENPALPESSNGRDSVLVPGGFDENMSHLPLLRLVHQRIEERLSFPQELLEKSDDMFFNLKIQLRPDGSLETIWVDRATPTKMQAWVMSQIRESLAPALPAAIQAKEPYLLQAEFHFEQPIRGMRRPKVYTPIVGDVLVFSRFRYDDGVSAVSEKADPLSPTGHRDSQEGTVEFIALFQKLFGEKKTDPSRIVWDLNYRLNEATHACESGHSDGACYVSGQIEEAFGHRSAALKWYEFGCAQGNALSCERKQAASRAEPRFAKPRPVASPS